MDKASFRELLAKYRDHTLTAEEARLLDDWYDSFGGDENITPLREREAGIAQAIRTALMAHAGGRRRKTAWLRIAAAACMTGLLAAGALFLLRDNMNMTSKAPVLAQYDTVRTGTGEIKKIRLPDSSAIWLNAGSMVRFRTGHFTDQRVVFLDEGEAFFEVAHAPAHPFEVRTPALVTQVLGTSFNIRSYRQLGYTAVQVKTGKVKVRGVAAGDSLFLKARESTILENGRLRSNTAARFDASLWRKGIIRLQEASFAEVALVLQHRYGITLRAEVPEAAEYRYTVSVYENSSLEDILALICAVHNNQFRRYKNEVTIY